MSGEVVAIEVGDFNVSGRAEQPERLRLSISRIEPYMLIAETTSVLLQFSEQLSTDPTASRRLVEKDPPDLSHLGVDRLEPPAAHWSSIKVGNDPCAARRAEFGWIGAGANAGIPSGVARGDVGEEGALQLTGRIRISGFKRHSQPKILTFHQRDESTKERICRDLREERHAAR